MSRYELRARLVDEPIKNIHSGKRPGFFVTRGTSATFPLNLLGRTYEFEQLKQVSFVFKQNNDFCIFNLYNEDGSLNTKFVHNIQKLPENHKLVDILYLNLDEKDTSWFESTKDKDFVEFEIVIKFAQLANHDESLVHTFIETQSPVAVSDSIYGHILGE